MSERRCIRCGEFKPIAEFYRDKRTPEGAARACKACDLYWRKPGAIRPNPVCKIAGCGRLLRTGNLSGHCTQHYYLSPMAKKSKSRQTHSAGSGARWREMSPEQRVAQRQANKLASQRWRAKNQEKKKAINKAWVSKNLEAKRAITRRAAIKLRATPSGLLGHRMSTRLRASLRDLKAGRSWESLLGYTVNDLVKHLESRFTEGMTWERFHKGEIHIDHYKPIHEFTGITSAEDAAFKECWGLANLQPLWVADHHRKSGAETKRRAKADRLRQRYELMKARTAPPTGLVKLGEASNTDEH